MKYLVLVGDGMADMPLEELDGKTPLQVASTPNMDFIANNGRNGIVKTIPDGMEPGSDVAILSILGYAPRRYYTGRGPLEAAGMDVVLNRYDVAFRCNLVTVKDGVMIDHSAGHIPTEESRILIKYVDEKLGDERTKFYHGIGYRHLLVLGNGNGKSVKCTPPHDIVGQPIGRHMPHGDDAVSLKGLMRDSRLILDEHDVNRRRVSAGKNPANMIWLWGQGTAPVMPSFERLYGINGSVISDVSVVKGIGRYADLNVVNVPGATGYLDTNYEGMAEHALRALKNGDFVFVHVEAPDEAGHMGDSGAKIKAIEDFDEKVVGRVLDNTHDEYRIMVLSDHPTPISLRAHTTEPVPFAIYSTDGGADDIRTFDEASARKGIFLKDGNKLMDLLIHNKL